MQHECEFSCLPAGGAEWPPSTHVFVRGRQRTSLVCHHQHFLLLILLYTHTHARRGLCMYTDCWPQHITILMSQITNCKGIYHWNLVSHESQFKQPGDSDPDFDSKEGTKTLHLKKAAYLTEGKTDTTASPPTSSNNKQQQPQAATTNNNKQQQ